MLTVESLVAECGLELAVAGERAKRPIRWVHISELEDPTQWLSGGELLLTTGMQLSSPARQRRFVERLAEHDVAGLGLGTGFSHRSDSEGAHRGGGGARPAAVRGPVRDAVHRDHGTRLLAPRQRGVRRPAARRAPARAAGAACHRGPWPGGDPRDHRRGRGRSRCPERLGGRRDRRASPWLVAGRRRAGGAAGGGRRPRRVRVGRAPSSRATARSPAARSRSRFPGAAARRRWPG